MLTQGTPCILDVADDVTTPRGHRKCMCVHSLMCRCTVSVVIQEQGGELAHNVATPQMQFACIDRAANTAYALMLRGGGSSRDSI